MADPDPFDAAWDDATKPEPDAFDAAWDEGQPTVSPALLSEPVPTGLPDDEFNAKHGGGYQPIDFEQQLGVAPYQPPKLSDDAKRIQEIVGGLNAPTTQDGVDKHAAILDLARKTRLDFNVVAQNFDKVYERHIQAKEDPEQWLKENPQLGEWILRNKAAGVIVKKDPGLGALSKAINAVTGFIFGSREDVEALRRLTGGAPEVDFAPTREGMAIESKPQDLLQDEKSKRVNEMTLGGLRAIGERTNESVAGLNANALSWEIMLRRRAGKGTAHLESMEHNYRMLAQPRDYEQGEVGRGFSSAFIGASSSIYGMKDAPKGALAGGLVGGLIGAIGGALTEGPVGAWELGKMGAGIGARLGGGTALVWGTARLEGGAAYHELLQAKTDDGKPVSEGFAAAGALLYAGLSTSIEFGPWSSMLKTLGPAGDFIKGQSYHQAIGALMKNPLFVQSAKRLAKQMASSAAGESFEETLQGMTDDAVKYLITSAQAQQAQKGKHGVFGAVDVPGRVMEGVEAIPASLLMAGVGTGANVVSSTAIKATAEPVSVVAAASALPRAMGGVTRLEFAINNLMVTEGRARESAAIIDELVKFNPAESPALKADPIGAAEALQAGGLRKSIFIEPLETLKFFQDSKVDPAIAAETFIGPGGMKTLQEAAETGSRVEIPLDAFLQKWSGTKLAKALQPHMTVARDIPTPLQIDEKETKAAIDRLVATFEDGTSDEAAPKTYGEMKWLEAAEKQLAYVKGNAGDARTKMNLFRAWVRTASERMGSDPDVLFEGHTLEIEAGAHMNAEMLLRKRMADPNFSREELFRDEPSGLPNRRAFLERSRPAGKKVGVIAVEGIKWLNDNADHKKTDAMTRTIALALDRAGLEVYKVGAGDFALYVTDEAELQSVMAKVKASLPEVMRGFEITSVLEAEIEREIDGEMKKLVGLDAASTLLQEHHDALVKEGKRADARPVKRDEMGEPILDADGKEQVGRPQRPYGMAKEGEDKAVAAALEFPIEQPNPALLEELSQKLTAMTPADFFDAAYRDQVTGEWTKLAWDKMPRKKHVASLDLSGLRLANQKYGKAWGNLMLEMMGTIAQQLGGERFDFTHHHGDEYSAQSDDPKALEGFVELLRAALYARPLPRFEQETGEWTYIPLEFHYGYANDYSLETADTDLNDRKDRLKAARAHGLGVGGRQRARSKADARGASRSGQGGPAAVQAGAAASAGPGGQGELRARPSAELESEASAEGRDDVRAGDGNLGDVAVGEIRDSLREAREAGVLPPETEGFAPNEAVAGYPRARAYIANATTNKEAAKAWFAWAVSMRGNGPKPAVPWYIVSTMARYGVVDPFENFTGDELGRDMAARKIKGKKGGFAAHGSRERRNGVGLTGRAADLWDERKSVPMGPNIYTQMPGHETVFYQFPTPEESLERMREEAVLTDLLIERGAKPVEDAESLVNVLRAEWVIRTDRNRQDGGTDASVSVVTDTGGLAGAHHNFDSLDAAEEFIRENVRRVRYAYVSNEELEEAMLDIVTANLERLESLGMAADWDIRTSPDEGFGPDVSGQEEQEAYEQGREDAERVSKEDGEMPARLSAADVEPTPAGREYRKGFNDFINGRPSRYDTPPESENLAGQAGVEAAPSPSQAIAGGVIVPRGYTGNVRFESESIEEIIAKMEAKEKATEARIAELVAQGKPLYEFKDKSGDAVVVSKDPSKPGKWRITWFDKEEPVGHSEAPTLEAALKRAPDYGADLGVKVESTGILYQDDSQLAPAGHGPREGFPLFQPAFHGSPHLFERFDLHAMGTGEGAQVYGWGMYFAQSKSVAQEYRGRLAGAEIRVGGAVVPKPPGLSERQTPHEKAMGRLHAHVAAIQALGHDVSSPDVQNAAVLDVIKQIESSLTANAELLERFEQNTPDWIKQAEPNPVSKQRKLVESLRGQLQAMEDVKAKGLTLKTEGRLYQVEVPENDELLNYDALLEEQPPALRERLQTLWEGIESEDQSGKNPTGGHLYKLLAHLNGPQGASEILREMGIPGLRYADQGSRSKSEKDRTYNFVIWDEARMPVTRFEQSDKKNLLVQHNLSAENILHAGEMGGLAAPSLAISRVEHPLEGFGEVTLLGKSSLADPETTPVFDADIYSPRYPTVRFKVDAKAVRALEKELAAHAKKTGSYIGNLDNEIEEEGVNAATKRSLKPAMELAWLTEQGKEPELPLAKPDPRYPGVSDSLGVQALIQAKIEQGDSVHMRGDDETSLTAAIKEAIAALPPDDDLHVMREVTADWIDEDGSIRARVIDNVALDARKFLEEKKGKIDKYAAEDVIKEAVDKAGRADFEGTARAAGAKRFRNLDAVKKARDQIKSREEFQERKKEMDERFGVLADRLKKYLAVDDVGFRTLDGLASAIGESYKRGKYLRKELEISGFDDVPDELVSEVADFAADLLAMPTEYFEAKPQRIVKLEEFAAAVVPSDVSPDVLKALQDNNVPIFVFDKGNEKARRETIAKASGERDLLFAEGPKSEGPRGHTEVMREGMNRLFKVVLNPNANHSTFLHEASHAFLLLMQDLSDREDAPKQIRVDFATILKWLDAKGHEDLRVKTDRDDDPARLRHEKFARGFERYLLEGKSPARKMVRMFERFRLWLTKVYEDPRILNVDLSDDIRNVFDRMLATDKEIESFKRSMGLEKPPLARDAFEHEADFEKYLEQRLALHSAVTRRIDLAVAKDRLREQEAWWKDELKKEREKAGDEYEALPERRAALTLAGKGELWGKGGTDYIELFHADVVEAVGEEAAKKFHTTMDENAAVPPDHVAEYFDFPTGKAMLEAILALPPKDRWSDARATERMAEKHPDILDSKNELNEQISKGLHGDATLTYLMTEWAALGKKMTRPGAQSWEQQVTPIHAIAAAAKRYASERIVGRLDAGQALRAQMREADLCAKAIAKQNYAQAFIHKEKQLLNFFLYRELTQAVEEREKFIELAENLGRDVEGGRTGRKSELGRANPIYREGAASLLEAIGLAPAGDGPGASIEDIIKQMEADNQVVAIDPIELEKIEVKPRGWKDLTVAQMRIVRDALANIAAAARGVATVMRGDKRVDFEEQVDRLVAEGNRKPPIKASTDEGAEFLPELIGGFWQSADGWMLTPETMLGKWIGDNDIHSEAFQSLVLPLVQAKHKEVDLLRGPVKRIIAAFDSLPAKIAARQTESIDGAALFPNHTDLVGVPQRRWQLLAMLLNMGNAGNIKRLTEGRGITAQQVWDAALKVGITREEYEWLQAVWDACEDLKEPAFALEEKLNGVRPEEVVAVPFETPFGKFRGGYFPVVFDRRGLSGVGQKQMEQQLMDPHYVPVGTHQNHLKKRAQDFADVISLSLPIIQRHLAAVAHDIAFREPVLSTFRLLSDVRVKEMLQKRIGDKRYPRLLEWVKDVGRNRGGESTAISPWVATMKFLRGNLAVAVLGGSLQNAAEDLVTGLATASFGSELKAVHLAAGMAAVKDPRMSSDNIKRAHEKSGELRARREQLSRELLTAISKLIARSPLARGAMRYIKDHAFVVQEQVDKVVSTAIWIGAERQALAEGQSEKDAIVFADKAVRGLLPSHHIVDSSALMRNETIATMLVFFRFFNQAYQIARRHGPGFFSDMDTPRKAAEWLGYLFAFAILGSLVGRGQGPDKDEPWEQWFTRKLVVGAASKYPWGGELAEVGWDMAMKKLGQPHGRSKDPRNTSILGMVVGIAKLMEKALNGDKEADERVEAAVRAMGLLTGQPVGQPLKMGLYGYRLAVGKRRARGPGDVVGGFFYGESEHQPANLGTLVEDAREGRLVKHPGPSR